MGGLSKKSTLLNNLTTSANILKIDAGTLFFDEKISSLPERLAQALINASAMVEAYNHMGFDAVAIGRRDLEAGIDPLLKLADKANFPFLSANLVDTKGSLFFKPFSHLERAGIRIAIIGLTGQANLPETCKDTVQVLDWQKVLPQIMTQISTKSDLVILLSNLSARENSAIAEQFTDVHLIYQSGVNTQNMRPQLINNTLITHVGHDGKYQGQLTVNWTAAGKWQQAENSHLALQKEYDRLGWIINKVRKKGGPELVYKDNEVHRQTFLQKQLRYQELEVEIKKMSQGEKENTPPPATYSNHFHPLPPTVKDDQTIIKLLQVSRKEANKIRRQATDTRKLDSYTGSDSCRNCHEQIYLAWNQTGHASSYQTLEKRDQNNNVNCVFCHVTGVDKNTAYLSSSLPETLKSVGCEACHGPGRNHAADPLLARPAITPDSGLCTQCHNPERDDNFNYFEDKQKIH